MVLLPTSRLPPVPSQPLPSTPTRPEEGPEDGSRNTVNETFSSVERFGSRINSGSGSGGRTETSPVIISVLGTDTTSSRNGLNWSWIKGRKNECMRDGIDLVSDTEEIRTCVVCKSKGNPTLKEDTEMESNQWQINTLWMIPWPVLSGLFEDKLGVLGLQKTRLYGSSRTGGSSRVEMTTTTKYRA